MTFRTRFAPSPTGPLHLGHAHSACLAHDMARAQDGEFLLRLEDIDHSRARKEWRDLILEDLTWLGLTWDEPVLAQSSRLPAYRAVTAELWDRGLLFACTCNRRDILNALSAPQEGVPTGPDGIVYPGTCRHQKKGSTFKLQPNAVLRLDIRAALAEIGRLPGFVETGSGPDGQTGFVATSAELAIKQVGDVVLARRDMGTSYHLSVVLDDAFQQITHVVRGQDLFEATYIHVILQTLLGLPTPIYHHHGLVRDANGKRLAKRDDARAIHLYRAEGKTPAEVKALAEKSLDID